MAPHVIYGHEASAEPDRSDTFRYLFADARRFFLVADYFVGAAVDRAHRTPLGSRGITPMDRVAGCVASKDVHCPMVWISNECAGFDQHPLLYGRRHGMPLFIGTPIGQPHDLPVETRTRAQGVGEWAYPRPSMKVLLSIVGSTDDAEVDTRPRRLAQAHQPIRLVQSFGRKLTSL
jgi:hypothetical protein